MRKMHILAVILSLVFLISIVSSTSIVKAQSNNNNKIEKKGLDFSENPVSLKNPFKKIWKSIKDLREDVNKIRDSISDLQ